ncbi:signal peptide peptidase SppA [Ignavibacteria bacterium]
MLIIGGVIVLFIAGVIAFFASLGNSIEEAFNTKKEVIVKKNSALVINFNRPLQEYYPASGLSFGNASSPTPFLEALQAIKRAKNDENIRGIFIKSSGVNTGFARASELQDALTDFKRSGKFIYAYIESGGKQDLYLALPADSIFMPQQGYVTLNAGGASVMFYKGLLEKLGVDVYVEQFEEYKSFGEQFSRTNFTEPAKAELRSLIEQRNKAYNGAVAKYRRLPVERVSTAINHGLFRSDSLLAAGFIDALAGEESVRDRIEKRITASETDGKSEEKPDKKKNKVNFVSLDDYAASNSGADNKDNAGKEKQIAIIYGVGGIRSGKSGGSFGSDAEIASSTFISYIKKVREDDNIKAVILRIDSPGGSALASDLIWEEIRKTSAVKPVYASMSEVAASGGYYIPMACDTIIASPHTITGSIGVIAVIPSFKGTLDKVGLSVDTISTGESSQFMNPMLGYDAAQRARFRSMMEPIYTEFVSKAAKSRKKTYDEMRALAKGRVWSGVDAKNAGLVDVLGGFQTAISIAKRRIGVADSVKVIVQEYPRRTTGLAALLKMLNASGSDEDDEQISQGNAVEKMINNKTWQALAESGAIPETLLAHARYVAQIARISREEHTLAVLPYILDIR